MINWKEEYKKLYKCLIVVTILIITALVMFIFTFAGVTKKLQDKDKKLTEQAIEIVDLKEIINERGEK
nr:MAG TPA: Type II secretion system, protein M [Caudoviricetes sp.]